MTSRATFGDFATAVSVQFDSLASPTLTSTDGPRTGDVLETARAVRRAIRPMARHVDDVLAAYETFPPRGQHAPWIRAARRAREALANADAYLEPESGEDPPAQGRAGSRAAVTITAVAASMTAARDLLHTHSVTRADGSWEPRSEWAPVVTSVPVARAVLHEVGEWASQIAPHCGQAAISGMTGTHEERRALNAACQWLWVLAWAVEAAHEQQPVADSDVDLLHAIPASAPAPRHLPSGRETVAGLCDGIVTAAERAHSAALAEARTAPLAAGPASESFRQIAGNCTVTSWNCHLVLKAVAARSDLPPHLTARLRSAAQVADRARAAWLHVAAQWDTITTTVRCDLSPAAADAEDLALWTGRLAYADPHWTPALGPGGTTRSPQDLVNSPAELRRVVAALHHTCHAITRLAAHNHQQVQDAAAGRRLVVPERNLTDSSGRRYLFGLATPADASRLRSAYRDAETIGKRAETVLGVLAGAIQAPSRPLTATQTTGRARSLPAGSRIASMTARLRQHPPPGPAERVLVDLGVTHHADLKLASDLDKATSQLIIRAARTAGPTARRSPNLTASPGSAELINHLLATSEGNVAFNHPEPAAGSNDQGSGMVRVLLRTQLPRNLVAPSQARQHVRQALFDSGLAA